MSLVLLASLPLAPGVGGCTVIVTASALSVNATVGEAAIDLKSMMFTGLLLGFLPIDILLTLAAVDGEDFGISLETHRREIRLALARGEGPFVDALGAAFALDADGRKDLKLAMREHRAALDKPLAEDGPIDAERAQRFTEALVAALRSRPELAAKVDAGAIAWAETRRPHD
jgi:hypothetical protein